MGYRTQGAAEQHSIKSRKSSSYAVAVPLQTTLHDSPPAVRLLLQTDNAKKRVMERSYFGCGLSRAMKSVDNSPAAFSARPIQRLRARLPCSEGWLNIPYCFRMPH